MRRAIAWEPWVLVVCFVAAVIAREGALHAFEHNLDEGVNLGTASLLARGHALYTEIACDQPPLGQYGLAGLIGWFGDDVAVARVLPLLASCTLLVAAWHVVRAAAGRVHATVAVLAIMLLPEYAMLSVAILMTMPSLALAMTALLAAASAQRSGSVRTAALAGVLLAASGLFKMFTLPLGAPILLGLVLRRDRRRAALAFAITSALAFAVALLVLAGTDGIEQITAPHLHARDVRAFDDLTVFRLLRGHRIQLVLAAAAAGGAFVVARRSWPGIQLLAWAVIGLGLSALHRPFWPHHQLLFTVPAAPLAAIAAIEIVARVPGAARIATRVRGAARAGVLVATAMLGSWAAFGPSWNATEGHLPEPASPAQRQLLDALAAHRDAIRWLFTDRPTYAFRARLPVPPDLVVLSWKRLESGSPTREQVAARVRELTPDAILLARYPWPALDEFLAAEYRPELTNAEGRLYLRR